MTDDRKTPTMTEAQERAAEYVVSQLTHLVFLLRDVGLPHLADRLSAFDLIDE